MYSLSKLTFINIFHISAIYPPVKWKMETSFSISKLLYSVSASFPTSSRFINVASREMLRNTLEISTSSTKIVHVDAMQSEKSIHLFHSRQRKTQAINFKMKRLLESFHFIFFVKIYKYIMHMVREHLK